LIQNQKGFDKEGKDPRGRTRNNFRGTQGGEIEPGPRKKKGKPRWPPKKTLSPSAKKGRKEKKIKKLATPRKGIRLPSG